jgi:hypothetical protein
MTPIQISLSACAAALALALGWLTDWGQGLSVVQVNIRAGASKLDTTTVLPDFKLSAEQNAYAQISERPLLNPSRRPAPTQAVVAVAPEPPKPQIRRGLYQLLGVSDYGEVKVAQVREMATSRVQTVRTGDKLQEMTVVKIEPTQVSLKFLDETDMLEMAKFTASGRVPQPTPVAVVQVPQPIPGIPAQSQPPLQPASTQPPIPTPLVPPVAAVNPVGGPPPGPLPPGAIDPATQALIRGRTSMRERLGIGRTPPPN